MSTESTLNWGILATGRIARIFAEGLALVPEARLLAVASRDQKSADAFAREYKVSRAYGSYEALVNDPDVQVVYVASPHSKHHADTLMSLRAGKAVLCEKPLAINSGEAREMINLAREKNLFLMEAMWTRYFPLMTKLREWLDGGRLGEVRMLTADFAFRTNAEERPRLFNPALGGGALLDVGIYPVALASWLFGRPSSIMSLAHLKNGVDEQCAMILGYENGQIAQLSAGITLDTPKEAILSGTKGQVRIHTPWWHPHRMTFSQPGQPDEVAEFPCNPNGYEHEIAEVTRCLREGRRESERMPLNESLAIAGTMDELRAQWGLRYPMESSDGPGA